MIKQEKEKQPKETKTKQNKLIKALNAVLK